MLIPWLPELDFVEPNQPTSLEILLHRVKPQKNVAI